MQTYKNFTRDHNIVGTTEENEKVKKKALEENQNEDFTVTMNKAAKRNRKNKKSGDQSQKNPYLRKNSSNGRTLIRVTQPRLMMASDANATSSQALPG